MTGTPLEQKCARGKDKEGRDKKKDKIEEELIPSFIIEEALYYYSQLEYYEVCKSIKMFFSKNSKYTIQTTRAEWFGITCCK